MNTTTNNTRIINEPMHVDRRDFYIAKARQMRSAMLRNIMRGVGGRLRSSFNARNHATPIAA